MAIFFFFSIADATGDVSTVEIPFPDATPVSVFNAGVAAVGALINPLVLGGLRSAGVKLEVDLSGTWGPVAQIASDVQEKMEFVSRSANGFLKRLNLPTIDEAFFVPGGDEGDLTDAAVSAFRDFLEDGITVGGTLIQPCTIHGEDLVTVEAIRENWGRNRRR